MIFVSVPVMLYELMLAESCSFKHHGYCSPCTDCPHSSRREGQEEGDYNRQL